MPEFTLRAHYHREVAGADICETCRRPLDGKAPRPIERFAPGDVVTIDDPTEVARLVKAGAIVEHEAPAEPTPDGDATGDDSTPPTDPATPTDPADVPKPAKAGPQGAWVDYAVAHGMDRAEAEAMSKEDLIAAVGD